MTALFGNILTATDVEQAAKAHIVNWYSAYLAELERQKGYTVGSIPRPQSWITTPDLDSMPATQTPYVLLISPGTAAQPKKTGGKGVHRATWELATAVVCSADNYANADALAKIYGAALRALLVQKGSLNGFAYGTVWLGEQTDELPFKDDRAQAASKNMFLVEVDDVLTQRAGPAAIAPPTPDPTVPYPPVGTADTVSTTMTLETPS